MSERLLRTWYGLVVANLLLAVVYATVGELALQVVNDTGLASPVWPSSGLAFALVLQFGLRLVPGVAVGSFLSNAYVMHADGRQTSVVLWVAGIIAVGAALQALLGRTLVHRFVGHHPSLVGPGQILRFLSLAGPVACALNASIGAGAQAAFGLLDATPLQVWVTWWVGDSIGVIMFGPLVLMLLSEQREVWFERRIKVAVPTLLAVVLAVAVFVQGAGLSRDRTDADLRGTADLAWHTLEDTMRVNSEILEGVRGLYLASEQVHRAEFREYTTNVLLHSPALQALSWNPLLHPGQLEAYVRQMRTAEGMPEYRLTEKDASGALIPVTPRAYYVVVSFIEPMERNSKALGYDIGSDPVRAIAIERAISTGRASATAPVTLVQESGQQQGFLVLLPIFPQAGIPSSPAERAHSVRGFAVGVYRAGDLLRNAFASSTWSRVDLRLTDVTEAATPINMAEVVSGAEGVRSERLHRTLQADGRVWRLDVTKVLAPGSATQLVNEPTVLLIGLLMAMLLMSFLLLTTGMERQARRDASVDPLTGLYNRRAMLSQLESARRLSQTMDSSHVLLFMDLDRFKAVNDTGGHATGDTLLAGIAEVLQGAVRERDTVARMGGDEFAVLLLECTVERGRALATEIIAAIGRHSVDCEGTPLRVGVSIGLTAIQPPDPDEVPELLRQADRASYVAKFAGGNRVVAHDVAARGVN